MLIEDLVGVLSILSDGALETVLGEFKDYKRDAEEDGEEIEVARAIVAIEAAEIVKVEREAIEKTEATH